MRALVVILSTLYALMNAFGAWMVIRRKPWVAALFLLAAGVLAVAAAAFISPVPFNRPLLASGLVLASVASLLNAILVIGKVFPRNHIIRAVLAALLYLLAEWALRA